LMSMQGSAITYVMGAYSNAVSWATRSEARSTRLLFTTT
jgi:hypothetical protein